MKSNKKNSTKNTQQTQNVQPNVNTNPEGHSHPPTNNNDIKVTKDEQQPVTPVTPVEPVQNQEQNDSNNEEKNITEAKVVEKPKNNKNTVTNSPTLDDVLEEKDESGEVDNDKNDNDNDIPND